MISGVVGYEDKYAVDCFGRIYSFPNKVRKGIRKVKPKVNNKGYLVIGLCRGAKTTYKSIHRIMAEAFLGDCNGMVVNHKNGIRADNRLENLELVSLGHNSLHGMYVLKNGRSKFTHEQAEKIKARVLSGEKQKHIAEELSVSPQVINMMVKCKTYANSGIAETYKD